MGGHERPGRLVGEFGRSSGPRELEDDNQRLWGRPHDSVGSEKCRDAKGRGLSSGGPPKPALSNMRLGKPSSPEHAMVCPKLAFAVPKMTASASLAASMDARDEVSVGSPSAVPVPCSSKHPMRFESR